MNCLLFIFFLVLSRCLLESHSDTGVVYCRPFIRLQQFKVSSTGVGHCITTCNEYISVEDSLQRLETRAQEEEEEGKKSEIMSKCARCGKTVYPTEELKCLDKVSVRLQHCYWFDRMLDDTCLCSPLLMTCFCVLDVFSLVSSAAMAQGLLQVWRMWDGIKHEKLQRLQ